MNQNEHDVIFGGGCTCHGGIVECGQGLTREQRAALFAKYLAEAAALLPVAAERLLRAANTRNANSSTE